MPDVQAAQRDKVGRAYARAYEVLYDEDVRMMTERQQQLDRRIDAVVSADSLLLGAVDEITAPLAFSLSDRSFVLQKVDDEWVVYPQRCPHHGLWRWTQIRRGRCAVRGMAIGLICSLANAWATVIRRLAEAASTDRSWSVNRAQSQLPANVGADFSI